MILKKYKKAYIKAINSKYRLKHEMMDLNYMMDHTQ